MLAFMGAVSACVNDDYVVEDVIKTKVSKEGLKISPTVSESSLVIANTRDGAIEDPLKERFLNTLDVFVEHITKGTPDGTIMKAYHLPYENGDNVQELVNNFLANSWRQQGLEMGEYYNVYVATNNPKTTSDVTNVAALKNLTYDEVTAGVATLTEDDNKNIASRSGNIYKKYVASQASASAAETSEKEFMMDGVIEGWTPDPDTEDQVFNVKLKRAAAKIVLNVNFAPEFLKELADDGLIVNWEGTDDSGQSAKASPAWKFNNFAFGAPVFTPAKTSGVEVHNSADNFFSKYEVETEGEGEEQVVKNISFNIITYTYPNAWLESDYATKAPSLVLSIRYYKVGGTASDYTQHYYRIPLVPQKIEGEPVTSIDRNTQYVINATIATRGSETHEDEDTVEDIYYKVTSWNNEGGEDQESGDVKSIQHYYLQVNPKVYTLRGDGEQIVDIHFSRAKRTYVDYKLFTLPTNAIDLSNDNPVTKNAYDPDEQGAPTNLVYGWYFSDDKKLVTSVDDMTHMGVTITNNNPEAATAESTEGFIRVKSKALTNRAIKYILLRVYLKDETGNDKSGAGYYEDVLIRHFPTDNIQSTQGKWSSKSISGWWVYNRAGNPGTSGTHNDDIFSTKYYNDGSIYYYSDSYRRWREDAGLNNPYKYVIQISSTSDQYTMGRPVLNQNYQSNDSVVSPAFMIASQLGATVSNSATAATAATHCRNYREVDVEVNGVEGETMWSNWRLPTRYEVGVILQYQKDEKINTIEPVLTGSFYWTLEGKAVATGVLEYGDTPEYDVWARDWSTRYRDRSYDYPGKRNNWGQYIDGVSDRGTFIRCIRDLSAKEIENLNKWNTIITKFQAKHN